MFKYSSYIVVFFGLIACSEETVEKPKEVKWSKSDSSTLSKNVAIDEEIKIRLFLEMHKDWKMTKTGSGLRYFVYEDGVGEPAKKGDRAEIEYIVTLLDGEECMRTAADEYEEIDVDQSDIESGIQEALKLLKSGDRAHLIIPSHIGHGLLGDMNKIPPLTTIVVDLHVLGIKRKS